MPAWARRRRRRTRVLRFASSRAGRARRASAGRGATAAASTSRQSGASWRSAASASRSTLGTTRRASSFYGRNRSASLLSPLGDCRRLSSRRLLARFYRKANDDVLDPTNDLSRHQSPRLKETDVHFSTTSTANFTRGRPGSSATTLSRRKRPFDHEKRARRRGSCRPSPSRRRRACSSATRCAEAPRGAHRDGARQHPRGAVRLADARLDRARSERTARAAGGGARRRRCFPSSGRGATLRAHDSPTARPSRST